MRYEVPPIIADHEPLKLVLPFPPTLNHNVGSHGARRYLTKEYRDFIEVAGYTWLAKKPRLWNPDARFGVWTKLFYGSRRRYDVDDRVKPTLDALTRAGVWRDDWQVDDQRSTRCEIDPVNPRAEVYIYKF